MCQFSFICLVEFTCKTTWSLSFVCWELVVFFLITDFVSLLVSVHIICFFLLQFWRAVYFHLFWAGKFVSMELFIILSYGICISAVLVVISPFLFHICALSFLIIQARGLSILFNQVLVSLILSIVLLIYFIFFLSDLDYFLLLTQALFVLFSNSSRQQVLLFEIFLVFLRKAYIAMNFPLTTPFANPTDFE